MELIFKRSRQWSSRFLLILASLILLSTQVLSVVAAANPLPPDELKALGEWTNWVADACGSSPSAAASTVTPGSGTPTGLQFPNLNPGAMATAIDKFISKEQPGSPLKNLGTTIVASAKDANVNPFLVVGIADQETSLATANTPQVSEGHAPFNRRALASQPHITIATGMWYKWTSFKASVDSSAPENKGAAGGGDIAAYLVFQYKDQINGNDLTSFIHAYDPAPGDWPTYISNLKQWMGDMANTANNSPGTTATTAKPTIVIDPGHSGNDISDTDPQTGLYDHDYPNIPEISEVFSVARKVQDKLQNDGYNVVMTKSGVNDNVSFRQRADIANKAEADLAISIHDSHDSSWSDIGTGSGVGGEVYVQKVGYYRQNKPGMGRGNGKVTSDDASVAQKSQQYGDIFAQERTKDENHKVAVATVNFNSRADLPSGNIPMVQLFSKVPWVYNEVGAPSGSLSQHELDEYAQGLVDSVEKSVPSSGAGTDTTGTASCKCATATFDTTTSLTGSDNREKIFNYFVGKGLTAIQAAAVVGNFGQESHWNPGSPGGYLAQWGGSRLTALQSFANKQNKPVTDLGLQLDYTWLELTGGPGAGEDRSNVLKALKGSNDIVNATTLFMGTLSAGGSIDGYENPGIPELANRINFAKAALHDFGNSTGSVSGSTPGCSSSISPDCASATGNAAILCEAKKYDPVDYVWGGGHAGGVPYHKACPTIKANDAACGLDCSGLVSVAVYDAFQGNGTQSWDTNSLRADTTNWHKVSFAQIQPGDVIEPDSGHVEIVDHVNGSKITTFGAHSSSFAQPDQVGPTSYTDSPGYLYYRYVGPGSGG